MKRKLPPDALDYYIALGPERSYEKVAKHFGVSKRSVTRHAGKEEWTRRFEEIERKAREESDQQSVEIVREMNERHVKIAKALQGKALEALRTLPIDKAADVIRALDLGVRQERLIFGEPSERSEVNVEEVTKREMQRWLVVGYGDDQTEAGE